MNTVVHLGSDLVDIFCWTTEIGLVRVQLWVGSLHSTTSCSLQARAGITEVHFLPFNPVDKRTAITYIDSDGNWHRVSKGAPEQIIELCEVKPDVKRKALDIIDKFADRGLRSLAVAQQVSSIGMFVCLLVVAVSFYIKDAISYDSTLYSIMGILSVVGVVGMIIAFSLGMGPIPWVIISEVFSPLVTTQKFWLRHWLSSLQELLNG